ncbi:hypothetical protein MLD38_001555 [Melastoma candidum]|uniref:Uncharacterized protein n=1 Tax=Melastoma candidum TaxID=119954 RepID=A0ACB9SF87_9MYRT|nr:hypothetical protein MLD38_001555 [Melastoma candidum]
MHSRYRGIATSAATAAAALLLQISLAVAAAPEMLLGTTMKTTSMAARSSSRGCNKTCGDHTLDMLSSYPFGFSPDCLIQLNCTPDGTASIGDFPVRNITTDTVTVHVSTMCDRPFRTIDPLFGQNFAPTSENEVLLGNCTPPSPCRLQPSILTSQFQPPCNTSLGTTRCYYGKENGSVFLSYSKLSDMKCGILASSELQLGTNQSMQLEGQTIQLGWWVNGDECKCSKGATCTRVSSIPGGGNGYRCQCKMWSTGDGFMEGSGCFNVLSLATKVGGVLLLILVLISAVAGICLFLCVYCCIKGKCCPQRRNKSHEKNVDVLMRSHGSCFPRSYGMLVLELIGGKDRTSVEASRSSEMYFPDWIYKHLESGKPLWMSEINCPEDEEIARKMMLVSLWCIQTHPIDRPPMSKVIDMLEGSVEQLGVPPKPHLPSPQGQVSNVSSTTVSV